MKKLQKFIAAILIIGFVLSLNFNLFLFKPRQAQAIPVVDVLKPVAEIPTNIKEFILDTIAHTIVQVILGALEQKIQNWGLGRKSDANTPFAVSNWVNYFKDALDVASAKFVSEFIGTNICAPIKLSLGSRLGLTTYYLDRPNYSMYGACTLGYAVDNVENFMKNPRISVYGMDAWRALTRPQNNILGSYFLAQERLEEMEEEEDRAAEKEIDVSGGYKNEKATTKTDVDACKGNCDDIYIYGEGEGDTEGYQTCLDNCDNLPGVAVETQLKEWGKNISDLMQKSLGSGVDKLLNADEISELLGVLYSALINKAITIGSGWFSSLTAKSPAQRARAQTKSTFSYQKDFKKQQTTQDIADSRSTTLNNILKAIQQFSRSITTCKDDEMMKYDDYTKTLADFLSSSVEGLYIELEGVNLKPDFAVLDPRFAPYTVYGYSWSEVPSMKFPNKCKGITDQLNMENNATCKNIVSGLEPPTPTVADLQAMMQRADPPRNTSWTTNPTTPCAQCMYDHDHLTCEPSPYPPQPYPTGGTEPWTDLIHQQKDEFWWGCRGAYNATLNRCEECIKKADERCQQEDPDQKEACVSNVCNNYSNINIENPLPSNDPATEIDEAALEFYDRCLIEEIKDACFTCLKEYFMPATYCEQTQDYIARSIIKYPALVKKVRNNAPDHEIWIGPYDEIMGEQGGDACDNNDEEEPIDLAIICRILPEFAEGSLSCRTSCSRGGLTGQTLIDALKDITDFRPNSRDCGNLKVDIGGKETWAPINDGEYQVRGKCCGVLWQHDTAKYAMCVGGGTATEPEDLCRGAGRWWLRPECWCREGERPLGEWSTSRNPLACCPDDSQCWGASDYPDSPTCRTACGNFQFTVPNNMAGINNIIVRTNPAPGGSVISISTQRCTNPNDSMCYYGMSNPSLYERLAEIFKPLLPLTAYAQACDCRVDHPEDCGDPDQWRCAFRARCNAGREPNDEQTGDCVERAAPGGNCNCNNDGECSGSTPICDLPEAGSDPPCNPGSTGKQGICVAGDPDSPGCDPATCLANDGYTGTPPETYFCQQEVHNSRGAEACCTNDRYPSGIGAIEIACNLSGQAGNAVWLSVTSDDFTDCKTTATLCVPCNPNDGRGTATTNDDYPYYGIRDAQGNLIDQCRFKIQ